MPGSRIHPDLRFDTIFEAAGVAICVAAADGTIMEVNPAMVAMSGYGADELRRMSIWDITHPNDVPAGMSRYEELISGHSKKFQVEKRYLRSDGEVLWGMVTLSAIPEPNGTPKFLIGIIEDITERKRAEVELLASREHLEASVRASHTGLWDWTLSTNEVYYSPEWKSLLGYGDEEVSGRLEEWLNRMHPEDRQRAIAAVLAFVKHPGPAFEMECRLRHKDGSYRWILSRASVLPGPDGTPRRMLGAHLDITERKRTEERLSEYEKVVEGLPEMIVVVNRDFRYLIANRAFLTTRDLTREQVIGHLIPEFLDHEVFHRIAKPKLEECFTGRIVKYELKITYPRIGERDLSVTYLPIEGPRGIDRVACVLDDITERKRAQEELLKTHQRLTAELQERTRAEQRVRALSDRLITAQEEERRSIARELHDDLSQEIAALSISVSNLTRNIPEEERWLRSQAEAVNERISRLAEGVRHVARQLHPAVLEYSGIAAALQSYGAELGAINGIGITVHATGEFGDVPAPVGLCLYRVAQEALQNVVKHAKAASATVHIERRTGSIHLMIKDPGLGFQGGSGGADRGLGLVSMNERIRLVNGVIVIQSSPGEGTTVSVSIPC